MPLKITRASEVIEVKNLTVCLYAVPGVGKTSMAFTADKPLLLDFDKGSYRSANRGDVVQVETWEDVTSITAADLAGYRTVVVDTAGRALDCLSADIIDGNPKMGRGGALTLQGYGQLKSEFIAWTKLVRSFGLDVVLLCHSDEQKNGDEMIERLDMQGGSKNEVYKAADVMGRIYLRNGRRILNFSPTDVAFGKNPAQLPPIAVPDYQAEPQFLAGVIAQTKAALNTLSALQVQVQAALAEWKAKVDAADSLDDINALVPLVKEASEDVRDNVKRMVVQVAKAHGFAFNQAAGKYEATAAPTAAETPSPEAAKGGRRTTRAA